jgi:hypothetical protein
VQVEFISSALKSKNPLLDDAPRLEGPLLRAVEWCAKHSIEHRNRVRLEVTARIEELGRTLRENGSVEAWFAGVDAATRLVLGDINVPLFEDLIRRLDYADSGVLDTFRGAPLTGILPSSGCGRYKEPVKLESAKELWENRVLGNARTVKTVVETEHDKAVYDLTVADALLNRMSTPFRYDAQKVDGVLNRRFPVVQGASIRCVDNATKSGCNPTASAAECIREHRLNVLFELAKALGLHGLSDLYLCKVDISAAFRSLPIREQDRWMAWVIFHAFGELWCSQHYALPFGFLGAVYGWERVAALLWHIAVCMLMLPLGKYVDDYFLVEEKGAADVGLECLCRVFRCLLGNSAINDKKVALGNPLTVLGFDVFLGPAWASFALNEAKRLSWTKGLADFLESGFMTADDAAQYAGRLSFASTFLFRRLGRAMLKPFFAQQYGTPDDCRVSRQLRLAIVWWLEALGRPQCEVFPFSSAQVQTVEVFTDAASGGAGRVPHIAAVVFVNGYCFYAHTEVTEAWMNWFLPRGDGQIMGLELLAVIFAQETFEKILTGRAVRFWIDNDGGCNGLIKGGASAPDHNMLVHRFWTKNFRDSVKPWEDRVPSADNIADGPTRGEFRLLEALGAPCVFSREPSTCWT